MHRLRIFTARLLNFFRRRHLDEDLDTELRDHLQRLTEENIRRGLTPKEAAQAARREFGGFEQTKEAYREQRSLPFVDTFLQDSRFAWRMLGKKPGFAIVVILTLAVGIGGNTAVFSMVNALLLHPYNFRDLDRLARVWEDGGIDEGFDARRIAAGDVADLNSGDIFDSLTAYRYAELNLSVQGNVQPVRACAVSANFFD